MRYFGFAKETTFGTAAANPSKYMDVGKCSLDAPSDPNLDLPSMEETPRRAKKGFYSPSGDIEIALDLTLIPHFLYYAMGGYKYTAGEESADPNTHEIWVKSGRDLPSFTSFIGKENSSTDGFEHKFIGCVANKFNLEISDGLATATVGVVSQKDARANIRTSGVNISDTYPLAFYETTTKNNNTDVSAPTKSFSMELDNSIKAEDGQGFGSMFPYRLLSNKKAVTIKSDVEFQGDGNLKKFWGGTNGPTPVTEYFTYEVNFTDEGGNTMKVYFPKLYFKTVPQEIEGRDLIKQSLEMGVLKSTVTLADDTTTVDTSCLVTIVNDETTVA